MNAENTYHWIIKVITSCKNYTQLKSAERLIKLYWSRYKENDSIMVDCEGLEHCYYWKCNELNKL